jgi:hypothetical protein
MVGPQSQSEAQMRGLNILPSAVSMESPHFPITTLSSREFHFLLSCHALTASIDFWMCDSGLGSV